MELVLAVEAVIDAMRNLATQIDLLLNNAGISGDAALS